MSLTLAAACAMLFSCGTYLLLQRRLTRILLGVSLLGHGAILALLVAGGPSGDPAFSDGTQTGGFSDPLVQALALTAIVITFAVTVFLLALARRSMSLNGDDEVEDDLEDRRVAALVGDEGLGDDDFELSTDEPEWGAS
jgi:multicomponent Na+:H+ antiporter subunit C